MTRPLRRAGALLGAVLLVSLPVTVPAFADLPHRGAAFEVDRVLPRADAQRSGQWYFGPMRLDEAQKLGKGGAGVTVAVIDTGVDIKQQDLRGAIVPGRVMFNDKPFDGIDTQPHGTAMAVLIGGRGHGDGKGLLGVAPQARIMPIRPVIDGLLVANGIRWAVDHGARVVNMSFGLDGLGDAVPDAIRYALSKDAVVVGAVGNESGPVDEPAKFAGVLGVGSVDRNGKATSFSNHGPEVDLVTYGVDIPLADPGNKYEVSGGTSASCALVAGAVALIRARYPEMSAAQVTQRLLDTATDRGPKGRDDRYGVGQLNLMAALTAPVQAAPAKTASPAPEPKPQSAPAAPDSGVPPWLIVTIVVLLLVLLGAVLMIVRARRSP